MDVQLQRCAGLDVHKRTVVACVRLTTAEGAVQQEVRTFGTMTADLLALGDWLAGYAVERVAMESTGVFWRPVFNLLEAHHAVVLVNPRHMRAVPGRKTDVKDAEWLAELLAHGLLQPSFIPPAPVRALRELVGYRRSLVQARTQEINRVHKLLELGNIKLAAVATDVLGKSGRAMLDGLVVGDQGAEALVELARGRLRAKLPALRQALEGHLQPHHQLLLQQMLAHLDFLEASLATVQVEIEQQLAPFEAAVALAQTLPGVGAVAAVGLIAELGPDMRVFPSHKHLASWAGVCPGNKQSGGKQFQARTRPGRPRLKALLCEVAQAIARTSNNYLAALYHRIARRRGKGRATLAVAHALLVVLYHMLLDQKPYTDLGTDYFDRLDTERLQHRYVQRLEHLGYTVTLTPGPAA
ncbi:MAG: IS110 family transposase [Ktedonobacterales bacterium]